MNQQAGARAVEKMIQQFGCLPSLGDNRIVDEFSATAVAEALEAEINKAADFGFTKLTLHMDLPDAVLLAKALRRVK